jgi:asparagine synthase (glutamine-hydrolysing)
MCGICGWVDYERDLEAPAARRELADMTATMACRGPDDEGTWVDGPAALGHRRLAIIDLAGGRQPMTLQDGGRTALALVYSGETYNFRELRERLASVGHRFETSSDTEVVLHAHQEWGRRDPRDAVRELNGMFAYAICPNRDHPSVRDRRTARGGRSLCPGSAVGHVKAGLQGRIERPFGVLYASQNWSLLCVG